MRKGEVVPLVFGMINNNRRGPDEALARGLQKAIAAKQNREQRAAGQDKQRLSRWSNLLANVSATILGLADRGGLISLFVQLGSMVLAALVGRFLMKSRAAILLVSFLGAFGAMVVNVMMDGQGAFLYLVFTPVIYFAAVAGRYDLRTF